MTSVKDQYLEIQGLLFDLDGTLIHTQKANLNAYNVALKQYGLEFNPEEFKLTNGMDSRNFLAEFFPQLKKVDIDKIREIKASVYHQYFSDTYLDKTLSNIVDYSFGDKCLGIVTTGKKINVLEILEFHKMNKKFDVIVTGDDIVHPKPSPEPYLKAIEITGLHPSQILVFEDSQIGCDSAIAAGLKVFRVPVGIRHET
jgi:beta-phosphoglucomutase-like phosphatase (HAD superfamily)